MIDTWGKSSEWMDVSKFIRSYPDLEKKEWCTLGNFDLKCTHKATSVGDKGPAQYVFTATVLPEDATAHGPFYIVVSKEDFDRNDIIVAKIQAARPGSGGYIKEGMSKNACLSSFIGSEISKLEEDIAERAVEHPTAGSCF